MAHAVMYIQHKEEDERAVETRIRKHKLVGTASDWLEPYRKEMHKVVSKRCREMWVSRVKCRFSLTITFLRKMHFNFFIAPMSWK